MERVRSKWRRDEIEAARLHSALGCDAPKNAPDSRGLVAAPAVQGDVGLTLQTALRFQSVSPCRTKKNRRVGASDA